MEKEITYKDETTGHILFGQKMLDQHTAELKKNTEAVSESNKVRKQELIFRWVVFGVVILTIIYLHKTQFLWHVINTYKGCSI